MPKPFFRVTVNCANIEAAILISIACSFKTRIKVPRRLKLVFSRLPVFRLINKFDQCFF